LNALTVFYIYALKDPSSSPAKPFYIGKGTGSRAFDHIARPDGTRKWKRIEEIRRNGFEPLVAILADDLSEAQALKLESELISAFGVEDSGGLLTNAVIPSGLGGKKRENIVIPHGVIEKAQLGLQLLKDSIVEFVSANDRGVGNSDVASLLGLRSDYLGRQKDYLSYSVLGLLLREGRLTRKDRKHFLK
jgi:uncharacterized protein